MLSPRELSPTDSRLGARSTLCVAHGLAHSRSAGSAAASRLRRGSSSRFFAFSPDLHEIESVIWILILEMWLQGVENSPSCLPSAAVIEFSIFLGSCSPRSGVGWAAWHTHSPSAGNKPKPCTSILLLSRAVANGLATPLNVMGMSPLQWPAGGVVGEVTFLHVICEGEKGRGSGWVLNKLHSLLPKPIVFL